MREFINSDREANSIQMQRSSFSGTFLLVESGSDKKFYNRFIDKSACEIRCFQGKEQVIAILNILEIRKVTGILAIVDADFDRIAPSYHNSPNLLRTDSHDLETMLIESPALNKVVTEFGSEEKIAKCDRDVRTILLEAGIAIGYLRWISQCDRLNLTFRGITFSKFVKKNLRVNQIELIEEVKKKSQNFSLNNEDLQNRIVEEKRNNYDSWQICCGHDLMAVLFYSLKEVIGSQKAQLLTSKKASRETQKIVETSLDPILRLSYEDIYFLKTQLYASIRTWETNHHPFQVLQNSA